MVQYSFEWDDHKDPLNQKRHGVAFADAQEAFYDQHRIVAQDEAHSEDEPRFFCIGQTPKGILTVRFTVRGRNIRIIGAGKWRKWSTFYEKTRHP
jgi:uncharacterized DUF497 family protein